MRDFVATEADRAVDPVDAVHLKVEVGDGIEREVAHAREMTTQAVQAQRAAAAKPAELPDVSAAAGSRLADTAAVMDISKGRVSQLIG